MEIIRRSLTYATLSGDVEIAIVVSEPIQGERDWSCAYEIGWPDHPRRGFGYGIDSTQAMLLTMQAIGTDIYTSDYHLSGRLRWEISGKGYGYPVPRTIKHLLVGDDAFVFG